MEIRLANPRGFCAGVDRAIEIVNRALEIYGSPVYVRHEVVHNRTVVSELRARGAIFVEELDEVPEGSLVIFSAHGVSQQVRTEAGSRNLRVFDATCPLVSKVHLEVDRFDRDGMETVLIGHAGHPEVEGTMGQYQDSSRIHLVQDLKEAENLIVKSGNKLSYVTQTTLSVDDTLEIVDLLRTRFPEIRGPKKDDICYATQNRQDAVKQLASQCDLLLVVGSANSSNSNRLRELGERLGCAAYLIDSEADIQDSWLVGKKSVGVTSGASAPETLVNGVIEWLHTRGGDLKDPILPSSENIEFALPKELRRQDVDRTPTRRR